MQGGKGGEVQFQLPVLGKGGLIACCILGTMTRDLHVRDARFISTAKPH